MDILSNYIFNFYKHANLARTFNYKIEKNYKIIVISYIPYFQLSKDQEYKYHPPTQPPINPAYSEAVAMKKSQQLATPIEVDTRKVQADSEVKSVNEDLEESQLKMNEIRIND